MMVILKEYAGLDVDRPIAYFQHSVSFLLHSHEIMKKVFFHSSFCIFDLSI